MPPVRVPNASFIASAELPILPFLAPRAFVESPITRRSNHHNVRPKSKQEHQMKSRDDLSGSNRVRKDPVIKVPCSTTCASRRPQDRSTAGGLLRSTHRSRESAKTEFPATSVELRYAQIAAFAHQSTRSYRVRSSGSREDAPCVTRISRTRAAPSRIAITRHVAEVAPEGETLGMRQQSPEVVAKREKALALERERLATLVAHELNQDMSSLIKHGQYRSLCRRITNLEQWDKTALDLCKRRGPLLKRVPLIQTFAALDRALYPGIGKHTRRVGIIHDPRCVRVMALLYRHNERNKTQQIWDKWMAFSLKIRQSIYQRLLIYLLHRKPARALQFLRILSSDRLLEGAKAETLADALGHLSKIHKRATYSSKEEWLDDKTMIRHHFVSGFIQIFLQALAPHRTVCSQDLLHNLASIASAKELKKVFDCLIENRAYLGFDTILHYANAFAKAGDATSALGCLHELRALSLSESWDAIVDRERLRWTCALILRKSMSEARNYHETPAIIAAIARLGIKINILLYNIVMHNAMEARDYATAFKVYNALEENGLKADKYTYSILLHGCTLQSNPAMFSQFAQYCADIAYETKDAWIATDYLYYIYIRLESDTEKSHVAVLLRETYLRFFPAETLELLRSRTGNADSASKATGAPKLEPTPAALYIIIQAEIQEALTLGTRQVLGLYHRFRMLMQQDSDPLVTELGKDPIVWNAFLYAFCQKQQFASASQLIKDMTNGGPQPNIYTWNIFMQAFFKSGQVEAAERVFKILRSRGIDPDQFTQGTLLRGYAKARLIDRIGETMLHVKSEDEMAPDVLRALAAIPDRNKLIYTLEKARIHKEAKAQEKAREEVEVEERRWKLPDFVKVASKGDPFSELPAPVRLPRIRVRARATYQAGVPEEPTLPDVRFDAPRILRQPLRFSIHGRSNKPANESWRKK
ncbi:hypothetical protein BDU57DRAFT_510584 [Ampelomyces quisqualis]|uniref:Pentacotripeptide-repeat region of PRORP domain-containing protein n=1 Tax=Ampelomyces quisqualis TaxID=50730 RepID=A0A6A5R701_AMPQU|nr:hypothetical protein BDU57DRAFT_510584 [Ampelomyces quisqualis]